MFQSILGFLAILAPLVIVHEFGHFFFAKLFNVKAETFSIGFGPRIFGRKIGETDFRLALIPLGGFVKLLGEDPSTELSPEDKVRALQHQKPWKRFLIFFGGPLFNLVFAAMVFMSIFVIGEPQMASVVGRVLPNSEAFRVGFKSGDRIVEVGGQPVRLFREVATIVSDAPDQMIPFKVERASAPGGVVVLEARTSSEEGYSAYGEQKRVGDVDGLIPVPLSARIGISDSKTVAALAGLVTGDEIVSYNDESISTWDALERRYQLEPHGASIRLQVKQAQGKTREIQMRKPESVRSMADAWGLRSSELFIEKPVTGSPAEKSDIRSGDRLVAVNDIEMTSFFQLRELIQSESEKNGKITVKIERDGVFLKKEIAPTATHHRDPNLKKKTEYTIGVVPYASYGEAETSIERVLNPFVLVYRGIERMIDVSWRNMVSIGKMITGEVSVATLGGPILIGKIAGDSLGKGLIAFLTTMGVLSVGLGILNILPIPVLDGGHILLLGIETIRRRPLSLRQMEIIQQVGLSLILVLMVIVMKNDISRLPFFNN